MKNIYKNLYSNQKNLGGFEDSPRIKNMLLIMDKLDFHRKNILDIGCYDGTLLSLIKNRDNNFYGLEASDYGVEKCLKRGINTRQFFFDGSEKLPYGDNFFDAIIVGEIIEHIFDTDFFLEEIKRILKPGGKMLLSTPNVASLGRRILLFFGRNPIIEISPNEEDSSGHIRYFTFKSLEKLLRKHGFKIIFKGSDCVNFSRSGSIRSNFMAKLFPGLGGGVIILSEK